MFFELLIINRIFVIKLIFFIEINIIFLNVIKVFYCNHLNEKFCFIKNILLINL